MTLQESLKAGFFGAMAIIERHQVDVMTQLGPFLAVEIYPAGSENMAPLQQYADVPALEQALTQRFPSYTQQSNVWQPEC